ncbi:MAG: protein kinase [Acidobacteria bacterium]|nr:protein kinase [Acidobacteriota bacterium]
MDKATSDPLVGKTVAQYEVVARLGGGGMGVVYSARDTKLGRRVALKFLPPQWSHDEGARQRFIREAQAASSTDHRNICTIHDIGSTDEGQLFIVMAHYEGRTLKQRLESGALPADEAVEIAAQVAEGLAKAHAQGVVHRDIKPGNLMLTEDGVKILDFGLAKFAESRFKLTLEGSTIGTLAYMSPEQARGEEADARSDVWAAGVVLYEMLSGDVPFKGAYPEAIAHAIKNDPPSPLRGCGEAGPPEIPEVLEHLVFRAVHKNPSVRFQRARDLARALRQLQGRTIPLDLRTEPLPPVTADGTAIPAVARPFTGRRRSWWRSRTGLSAAAAMSLLLVGGPLWVFAPVERMAVAVAPVVNQTGYAELDAYRLALTQELVAQLSDSPNIRVQPYDRLVSIVRGFQREGRDVSGPEALRAVATSSGASVVVMPTLLHEDNAWKARVEFRNVETSLNESPYETPPVVSSLMKDAVYGLMPALATGVEEHFLSAGPRRVAWANALRALTTADRPPPMPHMRTLDAVAAFAQGLDAYEQQEYAEARAAFANASQHDPRNPLVLAWRSRTATVLRIDDEAADLGRQADELVTDLTLARDRLFIAAVAAESRRDVPAAETLYRQRANQFGDDIDGWMDLAAFQDRRGLTREAITTYLDGLSRDTNNLRAHLELCRLYGPGRQNEPVSAREHGERAFEGYRELGTPGGEALARVCLADVLRSRPDAESRRQAREHADAALATFLDLGLAYNVPRGYNQAGMVAFSQGRMTDAVAAFEQSVASARTVGNRVLEPVALMNLGAAHGRRNLAVAVESYAQAARLFEGLGDNQRAAQVQANSASLRISFSDRPEEGLRDMQNALAVFRTVGDRNFELFSLQVIATYYRQTGNHVEAERQLNRALALVGEQDLNNRFASLTRDVGRSRLETADYVGARMRLAEAARIPERTDSTSARIYLALAHARLGDFAAARVELQRSTELQQQQNATGVLALLEATQGEVTYETGQLSEARSWFEKSAARWVDEFPDVASVLARAYVGLIDTLESRGADSRTAVQSSIDHARKIHHLSLEARSRVLLARVLVRQRQFDQALATLNETPPESGSQTLGPELRAQVHRWRGEALLGGGDRAAAAAELETARQLVAQLQASLPTEYRDGFASRRDIREIVQNTVRNVR